MRAALRVLLPKPLHRAAERARRDDGVSLPELLVAATLMLIAAAAVMALMLVAIRQSDNQSDRVVALDEARNGLVRMTSEIRSAAGLDSVSPQVLDVLVHVPTDTSEPYHWIRFKCAGNDQGNSQGVGGMCTRQDKTLNSGQDCTDGGVGDGCVVILRNVVKYDDADAFEEPCDNYDPATSEEKHFCVRDNRTVQLSVFIAVPEANNPIELRSAVTVRNCLDNQAQVLPCVASTPSA